MTFGRGETCLASDQLSSLEMRRRDSQDGQLSDKGTSASGEVRFGILAHELLALPSLLR